MKSYRIFLVLFMVIMLISNFVFAQETPEGATQTEGEECIGEFEEINIVKNGDFESKDLTPWEVVLINIKDFNKYQVEPFLGLLMWGRRNSEADGGYVGAKQSLENYKLEEKKKLKLSFDIVIFIQELDSDGWAGGEYPASVELIFMNGNNEEYVYKKCFILKGSPINYPENNVTEIERGYFYHFEEDLMQDSEISENILSHPYLKEIRVGGNGWDFMGAVDNIKLIAE